MRPNRSDIGKGLQGKCRGVAQPGILALAIVSAFVTPAVRSAASEERPFRLCADPTNLPFSSDSPSQSGFYLEIGQALARALDRPITYDWYKSYFGKRTVRVTLLGKRCDAMIGLPPSDDFMGPAVIFSRKFATEAYALVTEQNQPIDTIDGLKGRRVAVQYETTPQNLLAERDDIEKVTVLTPEEGMKALDQGKADVAFIWGPVAGWLNKTRYDGRYRVQTVEGKGLSWDAAIGFARTSTELRDQVNAALPQLERTIADLAMKYGLPTGQPVRFSATQAATKAASVEAADQRPTSPALPLTATTTVGSTASASLTVANTAPSPAAAKPELVSAGKEVFNGTCAHCHGPDAIQSERQIDLRLLQNRYGDDMRAKFWTTVHEGRPAKGMPPWKEVFTDEQFESIYAYLLTVQTPADPNN